MLGNSLQNTQEPNFLVVLLQSSCSIAELILVSDKLTITNLVIMLTPLFELTHSNREGTQLQLEVCLLSNWKGRVLILMGFCDKYMFLHS